MAGEYRGTSLISRVICQEAYNRCLYLTVILGRPSKNMIPRVFFRRLVPGVSSVTRTTTEASTTNQRQTQRHETLSLQDADVSINPCIPGDTSSYLAWLSCYPLSSSVLPFQPSCLWSLILRPNPQTV